MVRVPDYKTILRFAFMIVGWGDVFLSSRFAFDSTTRTMNFLFSFFSPTFFIGIVEAVIAICVVLATFPGAWFLCLATAWGLKRNRAWARRTGIAASVCILPSFPWLTAVGVAGLVAVLSLKEAEPANAQVASASGELPDNYWILKRESFAQVAVGFLVMIALIVFVPHSGWADFGPVPEWKWFLSSVVLFLFNVLIHEMGHLATAVLLAHRITVVNIGPWTFSRGSDRDKVQFDPKKLLSFGGYMGSVPVHCDQLRLRQIAVIVAGPIASLLGGAFLVATRFSTMAMEKGYALFFSWGAVVSLFCFISSIMPVGYSDGNMLMHLIFRTRAGELLLDHLRIAQKQIIQGAPVPSS
jgi:hypothetical protein